MSDAGSTTVSLGIGDTGMVVPSGWEAIEIGGGLLTDRTGEHPPIAGGVAEEVQGQFATNLLLYPGHGGLELPASALGDGQVWHDSRAVGSVSRVVVRFGETLGWATTSLHLWMEVEGRPLLAVATLASDRLTESWPVVAEIVRSLLDGDSEGLDRWF